MARFNDAGMDRPYGHFEDAFAFDPSEGILALLALKDCIPGHILLQWMHALWPVFMSDQSPQIGMPLRDQPEHVADLPLIPLRGVDVWRDGLKHTIVALQIGGEHHPLAPVGEREEVAELVACLSWSVIDRP